MYHRFEQKYDQLMYQGGKIHTHTCLMYHIKLVYTWWKNVLQMSNKHREYECINTVNLNIGQHNVSEVGIKKHQ